MDSAGNEPREAAEGPVDEPPTVDTGDDLAGAVRAYLEASLKVDDTDTTVDEGVPWRSGDPSPVAP